MLHRRCCCGGKISYRVIHSRFDRRSLLAEHQVQQKTGRSANLSQGPDMRSPERNEPGGSGGGQPPRNARFSQYSSLSELSAKVLT
jgi:hypothetical protein